MLTSVKLVTLGRLHNTGTIGDIREMVTLGGLHNARTIDVNLVTLGELHNARTIGDMSNWLHMVDFIMSELQEM